MIDGNGDFTRVSLARGRPFGKPAVAGKPSCGGQSLIFLSRDLEIRSVQWMFGNETLEFGQLNG